MNLKGALIISGIILTIVAVAVLSNSDLNDASNILPPPIMDKTTVTDESKIGLDSTVSDVPIISDFVEVTTDQENDIINFWIDENGTKHYVLEATDSPALEEN